MRQIPCDLTYIHIPKTGGTALKFLRHQKHTLPFRTPGAHTVTLRNTSVPVWFVVRDPLERFCSGFWERATTPERQKHAQQLKGLPSFGYAPYANNERAVFDACKTPNDLLTAFRESRFNPAQFRIHNGLGWMIAPLTYWLGNLDTYRELEHRVWSAVDIRSLTGWIKEIAGCSMPEDPFLKRSRSLFDRYQSYDVTDDNLQWFQNWAAEDYRLVEYIRTREYYYQDLAK